MATAKCSECGHEVEAETFGIAMTELRAHRRDEHPGVKSSHKSSVNERNARAGARRERLGEAEASGIGDPAPPMPERPPQDGGETTETAPARPKLRDRFWGRKSQGHDSQPQSRERAPRARRADTSDLLGMLWAGAGWLLVRSEADIPVGRCLIFQQQVAGDILQNVTRNTFIDKALQPLAARVDEIEALGSLIGIPLMVGLIERSPELQGPLEPMLRLALQAHLTAMLPVIKKQQAEEAKFAKVASELGLEGDDPIGAMLNSMFAPAANTETPADANAA
jgi:hypothetical protein